jgi:uncharacterized OB-fold protein
MAELDVTKKPLPRPGVESAPYWEGLNEGEIRLQRCDACSRVQFYPRSGCRYCGSTSLTWEAMSGHADVYTYTVVHRAPFEAFKEDVPYVIAVVELAEGPRLVTNVVGCPVDDVHIGMRVRPVFDRAGDDVTILRFTPA